MNNTRTNTLALDITGDVIILTTTILDHKVDYILTGSGSLSGDISVNSSSPEEGDTFKIFYKGIITLGSNTIVIFGKNLTQQEANTPCIIDTIYTNSTYITNITIDYNSLPNGVEGYKSNNIPSGGGTLTLYPRLDKRIQRFTGTVSLASSYTIQADNSSAMEGDEFWIHFDDTALVTLGVNTLTIFGNVIPSDDALAGGFSVLSYFNGSIWRGQIICRCETSLSGIHNEVTTVYVDSTYGNDSTGKVLRADLPFKTLAAATTAGLTLIPTSIARVRGVANGYFTESLVLKNYFDWNLQSCILDLQTGNETSTITDNGVTCDSVVYGTAKIIRRGSGTTPVGCISVSNASSNITVYCQDITNTTTGISDGAILCSNGTTTVYCNNISAYNYGIACGAGLQIVHYNNITSTNNIAIACSGGSQYTYGNNVSAPLGVGFSMSGGAQTGYCNDITVAGTSIDGGCVIGVTTGVQNIYCNTMNNSNNNTQTIYLSDAASQVINCHSTITGSSYANTIETASFSGSQIIRAENITASNTLLYFTGTGIGRYESRLRCTGTAKGIIIAADSGALVTIKTEECRCTNGQAVDVSSSNDATIIRLNGRFLSGGTNKDVIITDGGATSPDLILEAGTTLVSTGTGKSVIAATAATVIRTYPGVCGRTAVDGNISEVVSTILVDALVK